MVRICITGGPKTGKTTLANKLSLAGAAGLGAERDPVHHTDDTIPLGWSNDSAEVAKWFDEPGPWIIEGVAVSRALRKWRERHPGEPPPVDRVIRLTVPRVALSKGQAAMAKGEETVWQEIVDWLGDQGVKIEVEAMLRCEHPGQNGMAKL